MISRAEELRYGGDSDALLEQAQDIIRNLESEIGRLAAEVKALKANYRNAVSVSVDDGNVAYQQWAALRKVLSDIGRRASIGNLNHSEAPDCCAAIASIVQALEHVKRESQEGAGHD